MLNRKLLILFGILILIAGSLLISGGASSLLLSAESILNRPLNTAFWGIGLGHAGIELLLLGVNIILLDAFYKKNPGKILLLSSSVWILSFLAFAIFNAANIPYHDDYYFLEFLNSYSDKRDLSEIFTQGNESRLILMKGLCVILFHLGAFNFKALIVIPLLCLLGSAFLLFHSAILEKSHKHLLILLLTVLIFQFQYYDATIWASGALYNSCTLFFAIASVYCLTNKMKYGFLFALTASLLGVASCGAGFISLAVGSVILVTAKRKKESIVWILISVAVAALYLNNYSFSHNHYATAGGTESIAHKILSTLLFSVTFLGSSLQFLYQLWLPFLLGIFIWITFMIATARKYHLKNPTIYYIFLFLLLTSFAPPLLRKNLPMFEGINIRYGIYSIFSISCCILFWSEAIAQNKVKKILLYLFPVALSFHLLTGIFFFPEVALRKEEALKMAHNFKQTNSASLPVPYKQGPSNAVYLFNICKEKNIYQLPEE